MPKSEPVSFTFFIRSWRFATTVGSGWWLGNRPSVSQKRLVTSHPSFLRSFGATSPPVPLPASQTTFIGLLRDFCASVRVFEKPFSWKSVYSEIMSKFSIVPSRGVGLPSRDICDSSEAAFLTNVLSSCISWPWMVSLPPLTLKPLYSGGLWLPVIIMPPSRLSEWSEKYCRGVGHSPMSTQSIPLFARPSIRAFRKALELNLTSLPIDTLSSFFPSLSKRNSAYPAPSAFAKPVVKSFPNSPLMSYWGNSESFISFFASSFIWGAIYSGLLFFLRAEKKPFRSFLDSSSITLLRTSTLWFSLRSFETSYKLPHAPALGSKAANTIRLILDCIMAPMHMRQGSSVT